MDKFWNLLVANFLLLAALVLIALMYVFQNTVMTVIGFYGGLVLVLVGLGMGAFAIIDHSKEAKDKEQE